MKHYIINRVVLVLIWIFSSSGLSQMPQGAQAAVAKIDTPHVVHNTTAPADNVKPVNSTEPPDIARGRQIFYSRCGGCHKLTKERLVGPGLKGVTERKSEEWIINTLTHLDKMVGTDLDDMPLFMSDCAIKAQGRNLNTIQAKAVLEFIKYNDKKNN